MDEPREYLPILAQWRHWLEDHSESGQLVWLVYYEKHTGSGDMMI